MITADRAVALVGRPNVGKSQLFNALARKRIAIVHGQPGVTRDVNTVEVDGDYTLMDTGGIGLTPEMDAQQLADAVEEQVFFAVQAARVICYLVDGREGLTPLDEIISDRLRHLGKQPILVVNKIDDPGLEIKAAEFSRLGLATTVSVSAEHGRGLDALREVVSEALGPVLGVEPELETRRVRICFSGRPNVGKSSICNRLLASERLLVNEVPGTTRDSVALDLDFQFSEGNEIHFRLVDTAGLKRHGKVGSAVEYFSSVRSHHAIREADVVFLVLDAMSGVTRQDKNLGGEILEAGKALGVIVNKWDYAQETFSRDPLTGYKDEEDFRRTFLKALRKNLFFMPNSPVIFTSAKSGFGIEEVLHAAHEMDLILARELATSRVNQLLSQLLQRRHPRLVKGSRFKVYYGVQTGRRPFRIRLYCNQAARLDAPYRRYLAAGFNSEFGLRGCPLTFEIIGKPVRKAKSDARQSRPRPGKRKAHGR